MSDLKPCPFCGSSPRTEVRVTQMGGDTDNIDFGVVCTQCGTSKTYRMKIVKRAYFQEAERAMELAISAWNQRAEREEDDRNESAIQP